MQGEKEGNPALGYMRKSAKQAINVRSWDKSEIRCVVLGYWAKINLTEGIKNYGMWQIAAFQGVIVRFCNCKCNSNKKGDNKMVHAFFCAVINI